MERRTRLQLKILIAKHIKRSAKLLKNTHKVIIAFTFRWSDNSTIVTFSDKEYIIDGEYNINTFSELINEAFKETLCDGVLGIEVNCCRVILYGKPEASFNALQRLIYKYTKTEIDRDTVKKEKIVGGVVDKECTEYLCYNDDLCKNTIEWIRKNKTPKDILRYKRFSDVDDTPSLISGIKLSIETVHGKVKGERKIAIW